MPLPKDRLVWSVNEVPYTGAKAVGAREIVRLQILDEPPYFLTEAQAFEISNDLRRIVFRIRRRRA